MQLADRRPEVVLVDVSKRLNLMEDSYVVGDVLIIDDIGNESGNDQVVAPLTKQFVSHGFSISESELYNLRHENNPIAGNVLSAHLASSVKQKPPYKAPVKGSCLDLKFYMYRTHLSKGLTL